MLSTKNACGAFAQCTEVVQSMGALAGRAENAHNACSERERLMEHLLSARGLFRPCERLPRRAENAHMTCSERERLMEHLLSAWGLLRPCERLLRSIGGAGGPWCAGILGAPHKLQGRILLQDGACEGHYGRA